MSDPKPLSSLLPNRNDSNDRCQLPTSSPETSGAMTRLSPEAKAVICRFETPANLLASFNPQMQVQYTLDKRRAYMGKAPVLGVVGKAFSTGTAKSWVIVQLWDLAEFCGCKTKMTERQMDELAQIICAEYGYMKLTELMDFFRRFKTGEYGKFYGAVDPMVITCALQEFRRDRAQIIDRFRRDDEEERKRNDPEYIEFVRKQRRWEKICKFFVRNFGYPRDYTIEEFAEIWWLFNLGYERKDHGYKDE